MLKTIKWLALLITSLASCIVFIISLCSIESILAGSWTPIIVMFVSVAVFMFSFKSLDDWGAEDVDG